MMAGLREALMPRTAAARASGAPWYSPKVGLASILDQASLPGRAYVSLGRPEGEAYLDALGRTEPRYDIAGYHGEGDELAEALLRDPSLPLGAVGGMVRGLGRVGRAVADAGIGAATGGADQYAQGRRVSLGDLIGSAALGAVPSVAMGGKAPVSRMANEITPEQRAANFRNWFGDSKVVDEAGNPLVVYHGGVGDFDAFDKSVLGNTTNAESAKKAFFFSSSPKTASEYASVFGGREYKELNKKTLQAEQKAIRTQKSSDWDVFEKLSEQLDELNSQEMSGGRNSVTSGANVIPAYVSLRNPLVVDFAGKTYDEGAFNRALDDARKYGNDGVIFRNAKDDPVNHGLSSDIYSIFEPTQIKSATGNRGTFDPNDPNITHFAGRSPIARQSTPIQALGNRIKRGAAEASLRDYLSDGRKEQAGGPVRTGLGGFLLASPGDTPYTRRTR